MRNKIGVDIDQVSLNIVEPFLDFHNVKNGTSLTIDDVYVYNLAEVFGLSTEELQKIFDIFNAQHLMTLPPITGAIEAIRNLAADHDIIAVTSRPLKTKDMTIASLSRTFPNCFSEIHFTGQSFDLVNRHGRTKGSLCRELGLKYMVEDSLEHAKEIKEASPQTNVFLFGKYRWNETSGELPNGIVRTYTWADVVEEVRKLRN